MLVMDKEDEPIDYLTPAQAARLLYVSPKTVTRWAECGYIPCTTTLGGHRRFRRTDVEALQRLTQRP